jgi:lipoate-protein ligase A
VGAAAQWRLRDALLQHGSIPLRIDRVRLSAATGLGRRGGEGNGCSRFPAGLVRWAQADPDDWVAALMAGFEEELGVKLVRGRLTRREIELAKRLERQVYAAPAWTRRL